jgi:site-specific recombinase XerD
VSDLAPILQGFFRVKLIGQRDASPHTISSYRDAWRLLLHYAQQVTGTPPERMRLAQLDHELITGFLLHLETKRGNSARTRNNRLAAIHSLFRYAALHALDDAQVIQQVLAIESARTDDPQVPWLTEPEAAAVLAAPDRGRWVGRRDHAMMAVLLATGLRVSELLNLTRADARIQPAGSHVRCTGKGRHDRSTPLDPATAAVLGQWLDSTTGRPGDPLFPARGQTSRKLTRDGFQARLDKYQQIASRREPSLADKHLFPHLFRHTRAMNMRMAGHDVSIIALWLGHQDVSSTMKYLHADLKLKERALDRTAATEQQQGRYQPSDTVLDFLDNLTPPPRA